MNTPVNFESAKVLKEKGFNEPCTQLYFDGELKDITIQKVSYDDTVSSRYYIAPTIAEVVMWLYEKHGIWICIDKAEDFNWWKFNIRKLNDIGYERIGFGSELNSPKEAYEAGIIYTLKNLI